MALMTGPGTRLLLIERDSLLPLLRRTPEEAFDRPTVCTEWSVRDVLAHCASALVRVATGDVHGFTPEENQRDVDERKPWPLADVLAELERGYDLAAAADIGTGVPLGEWVHGGDVREALGRDDAYVSEGVDAALALVCDYSRRRGVPPTEVRLTDAAERGLPETLRLGDPARQPVGRLTTGTAGLVRVVAGRRAESVRHDVQGVDLAALRLFS
jgi:uncharacterized protein (TIGR03083 family)